VGLVAFFISALLDLFLFTSIEFFYHRWQPGNTFSEIWLVFFAVTQLISVFMQNIDETVQTTVKNTALERLDKLKTEFMGNMSHELKTPLSVITGYAHLADMSLAEEGGAVSAEVSRKLKLIASESERLGLMVSQILTATRIDEGRLQMNFELCDPAETVHAVLETYYAILNKNNNRLQADIDQDVPPVMADRHRLSQVIVNLISNALKHVSDGTITVSLWEKEGCVYFAVRDTGTGIAPELLPHLFSRYVGDEQQPDTRDTGTGLGLFICKHIVEGHGGEISIESRLGEGTAVTFYIPAAEI
jgi:signal transduction histidine kinase